MEGPDESNLRGVAGFEDVDAVFVRSLDADWLRAIERLGVV